MTMGAVADSAPPLVVVAHVAHAMTPELEIVTGEVAERGPPLVVVAMPPVAPLVRRNACPELTTHISPLFGEVGAVPGGKLRPAPPTAEAAVVSFALKVAADTVAVPVTLGLESVAVGKVRPLGSVTTSANVPLELRLRTDELT